ncbi:hypothetical protein [Methylobacterium pseudosasicola]|uniref:Uncharacterized protein n=1 Tax=Methylobacterium pseudosasicola TaxID=582667 RepID=A0A1I4U7L1_9HYPH|nr:hypothetical protein [Methylobacterium pseudosasicola]SFM84821.1 hypothetical protein SAMN05192568_106412 [Methylobacterium pseudosasicola]
MTWRPRSITPWHMRVGADGRTYDPGLIVECELFRDGLDLTTSPVWQIAPLTRLARAEIPALVGRGWHVRRVGETEPCAVVIWVMLHLFGGRLVSAAPQRAALNCSNRLLVVTPELIVAVRGAEPRHAFMHVADIVAGTRPNPRRRAPQIPPGDLEALDALAL